MGVGIPVDYDDTCSNFDNFKIMYRLSLSKMLAKIVCECVHVSIRVYIQVSAPILCIVLNNNT